MEALGNGFVRALPQTLLTAGWMLAQSGLCVDKHGRAGAGEGGRSCCVTSVTGPKGLSSFCLQGMFSEGLMHGQGTYIWADGVKYEVKHRLCRILVLNYNYETEWSGSYNETYYFHKCNSAHGLKEPTEPKNVGEK